MNNEDKLKRTWTNYSDERVFNYSTIIDLLNEYGQVLTYKSGATIVHGGDFPSEVFFIKKGKGAGKKYYDDGSEYRYFEVDNSNGNIGLLEVLAKKDAYVSTVTCVTDVIIIKVPSYIIYEKVMNDSKLLRSCLFLLSQDLYVASGNEGLLYKLNGTDRVRTYLIDYYNKNYKNENLLKVKAEYQEIAFDLGLSTRTIVRSFKTLKTNGEVISQNRKNYLNKKCINKINKELATI